MDFEVGVSGHIIGEKSGFPLRGDEFAGEGEELFLGLGQESSLAAEKIAAHQRFKQRELHGDLGSGPARLRGGAGGGAHHVAKVVERQAASRYRGRQRPQAFAGRIVEQHVVELSVVVGKCARGRSA